jgi:dTDP-4-amino-4,6-dideoxygalactose transaminase
MNAAYLLPQLEIADEINKKRLQLWNLYYQELKELEEKQKIELPYIPPECKHNAHMFYIKTRNLNERTDLINYLADHDIKAVFHYVPLHSSVAGKKYGNFVGEDRYTTKESERLLRLPMFYALKEEEVRYVADVIRRFYNAGKSEI